MYKKYFLISTLITVASLLLLCNLDNFYLWQDEAQTALLGRSVLKNGIPYGTDGINFFSQECEAEYGESFIWKWHTWLPFYIVAASFNIFGESTLSARLPFAMLGVATILFTYLVSSEILQNRRAAYLAMSLLILCIPFLILSRQCRYYSPAAFFSIFCIWSYLGILKGSKYANVFFVLSALLLFHTHYIYTASLLASVFIHSYIFYKHKFRIIIILCIVIAILSLPWIIWLSDMQYVQRYGQVTSNIKLMILKFLYYLIQIFVYIFSPFIFTVTITTWFIAKFKNKPFKFNNTISINNKIYILVFFTLITIVLLAICSPAPYFRYQAPIISPIIIVACWVIELTIQLNRIAGYLMIFSFIYFQPTYDYLYEISHDYNGPIEGIVKYLNTNAGDSDMVLITYGDMPLKFYTKLKIRGGLACDNISEISNPEWIIIRTHAICNADLAVKNFIVNNIDLTKYKTIEINYPDFPYENRESPEDHQFKTPTNVKNIQIYRKLY
jgi:hypothetical protein